MSNTTPDPKAMFKISYGLYVVTTKNGEKMNDCVINTCMQLTASPISIAVCVNKANYTEEMIKKTKRFNVSVLAQDAPMKLFEKFGFQSGRDTDKFENFSCYEITENGLPRLSKHCNAFFSAEVVNEIDCGTHTLFVAQLTQAQVLSDAPSMTYEYYFANVKPKPQEQKKKGWVCKICGYVYEGEELPPDFICPVCKHPASDFERIT